jgi:hypothetical protein
MKERKKYAVLFALLAAVAVAQTPQGVLDMFRGAAQALAERDVRGFLDNFDPAMKGYDVLQQRVTLLVGAAAAESSIEVVSDEGDGQTRKMQIDWFLRAGTSAPKRQIVKVTVERRGRSWKITTFEPVEFFSRD